MRKKTHNPGKNPTIGPAHGTPLWKPPSRNISETVSNKLWGVAAGRCEFLGCNRVVYRHPLTGESVNIAQRAHIYAFSAIGPRGHAVLREADLNKTENLLLACHACHKLIDSGETANPYTAEYLRGVKSEHERRVELVTGIHPSRKSHVLMYGANIGSQTAMVDMHAAASALFPRRYPFDGDGIPLSLKSSSFRDTSSAFWAMESEHLRKRFQERVVQGIEDQKISHLSVFALAPQPLLILLGTLLCDITEIEVYQRHREPPSWTWPSSRTTSTIRVQKPASIGGKPALVLSLSATIGLERVTSVIGSDASIWTVTVDSPHNDMLRSRMLLSRLRVALRSVLGEIQSHYPQSTILHVFPAAPVAANVELGRVRMPKANMAWQIYDEQQPHGFQPALSIHKGA